MADCLLWSMFSFHTRTVVLVVVERGDWERKQRDESQYQPLVMWFVKGGLKRLERINFLKSFEPTLNRLHDSDCVVGITGCSWCSSHHCLISLYHRRLANSSKYPPTTPRGNGNRSRATMATVNNHHTNTMTDREAWDATCLKPEVCFRFLNYTNVYLVLD